MKVEITIKMTLDPTFGPEDPEFVEQCCRQALWRLNKVTPKELATDGATDIDRKIEVKS